MVYTKRDGEQLRELYMRGTYQIDDKTLDALISDCTDCSFPDTVDKIFSTVLDAHRDRFPQSLDTDQQLKEQIKAELLEQALSLLSSYTTDYIPSTKKFVTNTKLEAVYMNEGSRKGQRRHRIKKNPIVYQDPKSLENQLKYLQAKVSTCAPHIISHSLMTNKGALLYCLRKGDYILEPSPLSDFIFDHLITCRNPYFYRTRREQNIGAKSRYLYAEEGRYLLAILLRQTFSSDIPYTEKTKDGISLQAFNELAKTLHYTYNLVDEIHSNPLERILFLINSENIFHLSLAHKAFDTYQRLFKKYGENASVGFKFSLHFLYDIQACPLNCLQIAFWDKYIENFFEVQDKLFIDGQTYVPTDERTFMKELEKLCQYNSRPIYDKDFIYATRDMADGFFFILFAVYDCLPSEIVLPINNGEIQISSTEAPEANEHAKEEYLQQYIDSCLRESAQRDAEANKNVLARMKILKSEILDYLCGDTEDSLTDRLKWSTLEYTGTETDFSYPVIPSIFSDILNFLCTYTLFYTATPDNPDFNSYINEIYSEYGITRYLRFLLHKKKDKGMKDKEKIDKGGK